MRIRRKRARKIRTGYDPEPMRILHVSTPMSWRGGEQQLNYLFKELERNDLQQCVLLRKGSAHEVELQKKGCPYATFSRKGPLNLSLAMTLRRLLLNYDPDLIHTHDAHAHTAAFLAALLFGVKLPIVVHRRVDFPVGRNRFSRWKFDHPCIARVIAVSDAIRRIGMEGVREKRKWVTIYDGIDPEGVRQRKDPKRIRKELGIDDGTPVIGNVAALADHKDHLTFLRTARAFIDRGNRGIFAIVGEGPERSNVEAERERLDLDEHVHLFGFREDVLELLSGFDLFLISSKTEGLGTSILDAMACGIPVLATNAGGIPEILEEGKNGILRDVGDHEGLAEALLKLLGDEELKDELVKEGKQTAERFSYQRMGEEVLQSYRTVLQQPR